jgi:hypothetical protein
LCESKATRKGRNRFEVPRVIQTGESSADKRARKEAAQVSQSSSAGLMHGARDLSKLSGGWNV